MPDKVGSVGPMLDPRPGPFASIGRLRGAPADAADNTAIDRELAWQTTVGQIVFLQSVVHEPT
jgi:hypothetical protein